MKRKCPACIGAAIFLTALLSWAVLTAAAQGMEAEIGRRVTEFTAQYVESASLVEPPPPAEVAATQYQDPRGYWMNEVISPTYERDRKLFIGKEVLLGHYIDYVDEAYIQDSILTYCDFKKDKWLEQMGGTGCPYYQDGGYMVRYLTGRGVPWEFGLIVLEFESSFGPGAPGNPWGFIGGSSSIESFCNFAAGRCGSVDEFVEWYHNPADSGHAMYKANFHNRMIQIQAFCP